MNRGIPGNEKETRRKRRPVTEKVSFLKVMISLKYVVAVSRHSL